jgi:predicted transcriptional regulator
MCSTTDELLARLGRAIDDLAADSRSQPHAGAAEHVADRLADIWAMVAELDPGLARRLAGYHAAPE